MKLSACVFNVGMSGQPNQMEKGNSEAGRINFYFFEFQIEIENKLILRRFEQDFWKVIVRITYLN